MQKLPGALLLCLLTCKLSIAQTGSAKEPVRYIGGVTVDPSVHDGRLRWAIGVENRQVLRANRSHPELSDNFGWTYNHAPFIAYWNHQFYLQYLSNPVNEHEAPGHTLIMTAKDGQHWTLPQEVFPPYQAPPGVKIPEGYKGYMMHQRMGFYVAPNGRLLTVAFYGHTEHPFREGGIGRVVREIHKDGTFGPIHFIRYSSYNKWNESNTSFPFYTHSTDTGFVNACAALLSDRLMNFQWLDEDSGNDDFYPNFKTYKDSVNALSYFHRKDGKVVALWKKSWTALSDDEGKTFSKPVRVPTLLMAGGKNWGQRTKDGRYAMVYNPIETQEYRYPLALVTSDDGIIFDDLLLVHGEVPPRRFYGRWKDFGPNYIRGIEEGNGVPPGNDMWLAYSVNKEDIWVARVPLPVKYKVTGPVKDNFNGTGKDNFTGTVKNNTINTGKDNSISDGKSNSISAGKDNSISTVKDNAINPLKDWNIYAPQWAPVTIANNALRLADKDPYDYARAIRVFKESRQTKLQLKVSPQQNDHGMLDIDITDRFGNRPVRISFSEQGYITAQDGDSIKQLQPYIPGTWYTIDITITNKNYAITINKKQFLQHAQLAEAVKSVERLSLRTGPYRNLPNRKTPNQVESGPLAGADDPLPEAVFYIDDVLIQ
ncbi:hypothetical protein [[Flexibacter] sp. ATCC 35208]|uniref:hypothetical protein n=1 Tax=[Flexibacter] sp. ATCC 35208 TaxID=1936242 RepID=UPI0009D250E7|nr:hypothetical protein [[Flexibacter] sp. ATCC 35208]OMP79185.1 hypothetical protein BW716_11265 [[Flexibacter] sp. ATCC 35208]